MSTKTKREATVRVELTITVDRDGWELNFPDEKRVADIRESLNNAALGYLTDYLDRIGAEPKGE